MCLVSTAAILCWLCLRHCQGTKHALKTCGMEVLQRSVLKAVVKLLYLLPGCFSENKKLVCNSEWVVQLPEFSHLWFSGSCCFVAQPGFCFQLYSGWITYWPPSIYPVLAAAPWAPAPGPDSAGSGFASSRQGEVSWWRCRLSVAAAGLSLQPGSDL